MILLYQNFIKNALVFENIFIFLNVKVRYNSFRWKYENNKKYSYQ